MRPLILPPRRAAVLCLAAALAVRATGTPDALTIEDRKLFADGLFSRGLYARAAAEYAALANDHPALPDLDTVLFRWAEALRLDGRPKEAGAIHMRLVRERPDSAYRLRAMFQRGAIALVLGQYEAASELLAAVLDAQPPPELRAPALYYRGEALAQHGVADEAIALLETLLREHPESPLAAYAKLAVARLLATRGAADDVARSRELLRACADAPATPRLGAEALYLLAQGDFARGRFQESAAAYLELARRHPQDERTAATRLQAAWASHNAGLYAETLALAAQALGEAATPARDEWLYLQGNAELQLTRYREAVGTFGTLAQRHPESRFAGAAWYQMAVAHQRLGEFAEAVSAALRVPHADALRRDVLWLLGECHVALADSDRAVQYYRLLTEEFPADERAPQALYRLAHQFQSRESWGDAAAAYLQLVERFKDHELTPRALFAAGFCHARAGQSAQAVRDWNELARRHADHALVPEARFRKALEELRMDRAADALSSLDALLRDPRGDARHTEARFWRATLMQRKGDLPEAEKDLRAVLAAPPSKDVEREAAFLLGIVLQQAGRADDAARLFQGLLDDPLRTRFTPHQLAWLAEHQFARGAFAESAAAARRLTVQAPDDAWRQAAWTLVGRAARGAGDTAGAEAAFRSAVDIPGDRRYAAEARLRLGEIRLAAGDAAQAETHFRKAAELAGDPDLLSIRIQAHAGLGRALRQRGDLDAAARYLLGVCLLYQDATLLPPLLEETIPLLRELGRHDEARTLLADLRELYPESAAARKLGAGAEAPP